MGARGGNGVYAPALWRQQCPLVTIIDEEESKTTMDAEYSRKYNLKNIFKLILILKFPLLIDYALTLILYALMIALIVKVFASDHLHFRNPFEFDWDTHPANPNNLNIPDSTDSTDYPQ